MKCFFFSCCQSDSNKYTIQKGIVLTQAAVSQSSRETKTIQNTSKSDTVQDKQPKKSVDKENGVALPSSSKSSHSAVEEVVINEVDSSNDVPEGKEQRREGVRAEKVSFDEDKELVKHSKDKEDELIIKNAISANEFLRNVLKDDILQEIIDAMYKRIVEPNETIVTQGEKGMHLYVSAKGSYEVIISNKSEAKFSDQRVFGELAILYNDKRLATVKALKKGELWVLDRQDYQQIILKSAIKEQQENLSFLKNVPILNSADEKNLQRAANLLKREFFNTNTAIVREGDKGDKFYIIRAGTVAVSKEKEGKVATLSRGQFFGERALLQEEFRQATVTADAPGVECLTLDREEFKEYLGDIATFVEAKAKKSVEKLEVVRNEYSDIELNDLRRVKTLGVGGFGRVELVQHKKKDELTFALKYLKKIDMVQQQQKEHAFNEKQIQLSCDSIFIVKLYKTFKDTKYLYLLMESCLGGDLWTLLQKQKMRSFEEGAAKFLAACVLEALAYLHERDFVYRDLKPENLLLDSKGYVKLTDFGFAKHLGGRSKTFTFAGTPEYVAPEIVLNRGHDRAVDYWAFGIFVFELLVGKTPFRTNDVSHMKTYNLILSGIDNVTFPPKVPRNAQNLVKRLCRPKATDRLGVQRNGAQDIRNHKWFQGFEWEKLYSQNMKAPFVPKLKGPTDTQNFDKFEEDMDIPVDETSGWDDGF